MKYSLQCAQLSGIVYKDSNFIENYLQNSNDFPGASNFKFYDVDGTQAMSFLEGDVVYLVFRGTEPTQLSDIWADLKAWKVDSKYKKGRVHAGFRTALDKVWNEVSEYALTHGASGRSFVITGHSLGAALATLCSSRVAELFDNKIDLYTFGSPRVGSRGWTKSFNVDAYRFVNNNDVVTRVPSAITYRHMGKLVYFNHYGNVRNMTQWQRTKDRFRGFFKALIKLQGIDWFNDHSMKNYIELVEKNKGVLHDSI